MSRIEEDSKFFEEDAKWLLLDSAVLSVRKCLHNFIGALRQATEYFSGKTNDQPEVSLSKMFLIVCNNDCRAFEDLCDQIKVMESGSIPRSKVESILTLGTFLADRAEEFLPHDDLSCNDLRTAMTSLFNLASNTSLRMARSTFEESVEKTRREICAGFKSLSDGFSKLERRRKHGDKSEPLRVDLSDDAKKFIQDVGDGVSGKVENAAEEVNDRLDNQAARLKGAEHQIELARKGNGQITKKTYGGGVPEKAFWMWIEATAKFGEKHQRDDGFAYFNGKLKDVGIESADEWQHVTNNYRKRRHLCIRVEVQKWSEAHSETSEWRGRKCA